MRFIWDKHWQQHMYSIRYVYTYKFIKILIVIDKNHWGKLGNVHNINLWRWHGWLVMELDSGYWGCRLSILVQAWAACMPCSLKAHMSASVTSLHNFTFLYRFPLCSACVHQVFPCSYYHPWWQLCALIWSSLMMTTLCLNMITHDDNLVP